MNKFIDISPIPLSGDIPFFDLEKDIKSFQSGDLYNMDQDYVFEPEHGINDSNIDFSHFIINIGADNISINGNNHGVLFKK